MLVGTHAGSDEVVAVLDIDHLLAGLLTCDFASRHRSSSRPPKPLAASASFTWQTRLLPLHALEMSMAGSGGGADLRGFS